MPLTRRYLTTTELCERWQVVRTTLYRWGIEGRIVPYKIGHHNLYKMEDVERVENELFKKVTYRRNRNGSEQ